MFCRKCGNQVNEKSNECMYCKERFAPRTKVYEKEMHYHNRFPWKTVVAIVAAVMVVTPLITVFSLDSKKAGQGYTTTETVTEVTTEGVDPSAGALIMLDAEEIYEFTTEAPTVKEVVTEKISGKTPYERDVEIYREYFENGGYDGVLRKYEEIQEGFRKDITICDLNGDDIYEAFVRCGNVTENYGGLLTIKDGMVESVLTVNIPKINTYDGNVYLEYKEQTDTFVVVSEFSANPGGYCYEEVKEIYYFNGSDVSVGERMESYILLKDEFSEEMNVEEIERIKGETSLYEEEEDRFGYFMIDGEYVSSEDFNNALNGYRYWEFESVDIEI